MTPLASSAAAASGAAASEGCAATYESVHVWVARALEPLQAELLAILFPVFAHCSLRLADARAANAAAFVNAWGEAHAERFADEVDALRDHARPDGAAESEYVARVRASKFRVRLGKVASDVLCDYLMRSANVVILGILTDYVQLDVDAADAPRGFSPAVLIENDSDESDAPLLVRMPLALGVLCTDELAAPDAASPAVHPAYDDEYGAALLRDGTRRPLDERRASTLSGRGRRPMSALEPTLLALTVVGGDASQLCSLRPSRDGTRLCGGFLDCSARAWRLDELGRARGDCNENDAAHVAESDTPALVAHAGAVYSSSWSSESRYVLTAGGDGAVVLWDAESAGGNAACGGDDVPSGAREVALARYDAHAGACWDVQWSELSNGHLFATCGADKTARLFCTERSDPLRIFAGHWADVSRVAWHPNAHYLLTASCDGSARLWDVRAAGGSKSNCARILDGAAGALSALDCDPHGRMACAASVQGAVHVWCLDSGKQLWSDAKAHQGAPVYATAYSACGRAIATGGRDRAVRIWVSDLSARPSPAKCFPTNSASPIFDITWTPGNLCLVSGPLLA
mmetsp:Transcript_9831/g.34654  ORF Transcript_9831/g.34654 Transcript_9831/m.34654 type:complete len:574 (-) Transcript_9831:314-2035(-)